MTETLLIYLFGGAITSITSIAVGTLFGDRIRFFLSRFFHSQSTKVPSIDGVWLATFSMERNGVVHEYIEAIEIKLRYGSFVGRITPSKSNYETLARVQSKRPLRLRGELKDNLFFTGFWYHPIETSRYHGAFQLVVLPDGATMAGRWVGFSETLHRIESGSWSFARSPEHEFPLADKADKAKNAASE